MAFVFWGARVKVNMICLKIQKISGKKANLIFDFLKRNIYSRNLSQKCWDDCISDSTVSRGLGGTLLLATKVRGRKFRNLCIWDRPFISKCASGFDYKNNLVVK